MIKFNRQYLNNMLNLNDKEGVNMYREIFPARLRHARLEAGYTQQKVAEATGIPQSTITKYETGKLEPDLEKLGKLAEFYNVQINWLLGVTIDPNWKP